MACQTCLKNKKETLNLVTNSPASEVSSSKIVSLKKKNKTTNSSKINSLKKR